MPIDINLPVSELQKRSIFLAVPMYGGNCTGVFSRSVSDLASVCTHYGIKIQMYHLINESLITRARNYCADEFMRSDCTHLMFIDSDIGFNPHDVIALLSMSSDDSPYDIIGGPYPKKCISWEKIKTAVDKGFADNNPNDLDKFVGDYVFNPKSGTNSIRLDEPAEVLEIGTGFMMIRRSAMEKFRDTYPHLWYRPDHVRTEHFDGTRKIMAYFDCVIDRGYDWGDVHKLLNDTIDGKHTLDEIKKEAKSLLDRENSASLRYLSEDYKFCQDCLRAGLRIWLCPWMKLQHVGSFVFGGSLIDLAQLGVSATADVNELKKGKK